MSALTDAASQAASVSGLPYALTLALIQAEQGESQLAQTRNPFDVTTTWLTDTGNASAIAGTWNSVGVAIVTDIATAISSWWAGLSSFSLYATFRAHRAAGASVETLVKDLAATGYAGSDAGAWAANVLSLYQRNGGAPQPVYSAPNNPTSGLSSLSPFAKVAIGIGVAWLLLEVL